MYIDMLILKNKIRLEQMIKKNEDKQKILIQSQKLDKYINRKMEKMMKKIK